MPASLQPIKARSASPRQCSHRQLTVTAFEEWPAAFPVERGLSVGCQGKAATLIAPSYPLLSSSVSSLLRWRERQEEACRLHDSRICRAEKCRVAVKKGCHPESTAAGRKEAYDTGQEVQLILPSVVEYQRGGLCHRRRQPQQSSSSYGR